MQVIHHGTDAGDEDVTSASGEYILVVGNSYAHKGVDDTLPFLEGRGPVVLLGGGESSLRCQT